jgi:hypothetical protein
VFLREKIQDFFQLNTENEITIDLPPAQLKFLQEHMKDEVEKLERTLKQKNVIVAVKSDGILVKGNQQGVKDAADEVDSLVQKIYQMKHSMDKPGLQELMQTSKGKQKLMQVGKQADVFSWKKSCIFSRIIPASPFEVQSTVICS